jgi:adenylate cyclase
MPEQNPTPRPTPIPTGHGFRSWILIAGLALLITALLTGAERLGRFDGLHLQAYDWLVAVQGAEPPSSRIFNIDFDEDSVTRYNAFPIPRLLLADVIQKVASGKPSVIGVDVILDLPRAHDDDLHLAHTIDDAGDVILISEYGFGIHPPNAPLDIFQQAAAGVAFGDLPTDEDGAVRRMFLRVTTSDYKGFSLPVAVADLFSGEHLRPGGADFLLFGSRKLPLATNHPDTALIHFHPSAPTSVVPVQALLSSDFDSSIFQGKIVLVGQSSEKGKDLFATPVTRAGVTVAGRNLLSGTEIHGAAVESLLAGNILRTVHPFPRMAAGLLLAFVIILLAFRNRWWVALGACLVLAAGVFFAAFVLFSRYHTWMPFVSLEACLLTALPAGLGYRSVEERRLKNQMEAERRQLMGLFERYVSADVAAEIWKNRDSIVLAGEERVATILFSDIRSFTAMTAGVPSQQVLSWLNRYLTAMGEVVKKNRGFLNKFIGDGIMVVFGAPLSEGTREDACRAVRCALEMLASVDHWNATKPSSEPHLKIGIGIHSGPVTAGNVGSPDRLEYSVIGDTVNLASRLEALTKEFKTPLVLSPATWEYIRGQFPTVSLGDAQVRGFTSSISLYTVESQTAIEVHP